MTVQELYKEAIIGDYRSLIYLIEWLVFEKKALTMDRDARNIEYICAKYGDELNPHIKRYMMQQEGHGAIK